MYCLYLRKSRLERELEAKGELETLARHEKQLLSYAQAHSLPVTKIYKEVVSGESIDARPEMQKLLDEVENGKWEGVLVMEIERLARGDTIDQGIVARAFSRYNTKIITPIKTYDPSNEFDEEYFEFGLFMSRREYKTITRRIQRGRIQSAKEGRFLSSVPPYGYDKVKIKNDKGYTLSPNEAEAEVVKLIYDMYISGNGMTVIANALDKKGIKPRYRDTWSKSTISDILKNPVYMGKIRWAYRKEEKDYTDKRKIRKTRTVNNECIYVDGLHEAIITEDTFSKAQKIRKNNTRKSVKKDLTLKNPLSGVVFCKKCNAPMTRLGQSSHSKYDTLRCSNRYCDNVSAPIHLVEQEILNSINEWFTSVSLNAEEVYKNLNSKVNEKSLNPLKKELETISEQINKTYDLLEQGIYSTEMFTERNSLLSARKAETEGKIKELSEQLKEKVNLSDLRNKIIPRTKKLIRLYPTLPDAESRNKILKDLLLKATYEKTVKNNKGTVNRSNFSVEVFPNILSLKK